MSVKIMSAVFENETLGPTERLIMLALADHADDEGRCYPSIARLCRRTGLKERAIQTNVKSLSEKGYLTVNYGGGRNNSNLYTVRANPAPDAPRTKCAPAYDDIETPHMTTENPAPDAPKPLRTTIEPSEDITAHKRAKVRIPTDWHPGETGLAYALKQNIPMEVIEDEIEGFRVYWRDRTDAAGRKSPEGWLQCWQNRCRTISGRYAGRAPRRQQPQASQQFSGIAGAAMRSRAARQQGYEG